MTAANGFISALPIWSRSIGALRDGYSVLFAMPRYCGGRELLQSIGETYAREANRKAVSLNLRLLPGTDTADYMPLWRGIHTALAPRSRIVVRDHTSFERYLTAVMQENSGRILIVLSIGRGAAQITYEVLSLFHYFAAHFSDSQTESLQLIVADDFSFWFFQHYIADVDLFALYMIKEFTFTSLSEHEIERVLQSLLRGKLPEKAAPDLARQVHGATGGHIGLVRELCSDLQSRQCDSGPEGVRTATERIARESTVLESIRRDIQDDPAGISSTALEFKTAKYPVEYSSRRYQFLRQIGILEWTSESQARLCGGVITRFFEDVAAQETPQRTDALPRYIGLRQREEQESLLDDDDFVILHLSDLHVGEEHGFRLSYSGHCQNEGLNSLGEMLEEDLARMKLRDRVDGVVISGDLVCTGSFEEFNRAREVVRDVLDRAGVQEGRLVVVPGNHDVQWNPAKFAGRSTTSPNVTREAYDIFLELLGQKTALPIVFREIRSRRNGRCLRLIGLDSNFVEGPEASGIGFVARDSLDVAARLVGGAEESQDSCVKWVVVHHHVLPVSSADLAQARERSVSVMGNAPEVLSRAMKWGVETILHGHEHHPAVTSAQRWVGDTEEQDFRPVIVVGAGSCGAKRENLGPLARNHYYVLVRTPRSLLVRSRVLGEEGLNFRKHKDLVIDLP